MPYRGYKRDVQQPTVEAARLLDTPARGEVFLTRRNTENGEMVVFAEERLTFGLSTITETKTLAEVPIEAVRIAARTLTELTKLVFASTITLSLKDNLDLSIFKFEDETHRVYLKDAEDGELLGCWDLEDIDPF